MSSQPMRPESDALVVTPLWVGLMTIATLKFFAVHRRDIGSKVALMIELQYIRIAHWLALKLKLRVTIPESREDLGITARGPR